MDLTLLAVGVGSIVVGFVLAVIGSWLADREQAGVGDEGSQATIVAIVAIALSELVSSIRRVIDGPRLADRVQGLGSALVWLGVALIALFIVLAMAGAID